MIVSDLTRKAEAQLSAFALPRQFQNPFRREKGCMTNI